MMFTAKSRRRHPVRWLKFLFLMTAIVGAGVQLNGPPDPAGSGLSAVMVDASDGGVLYEVNADAARPVGDASRLMALYLVFEALDAGRIRLTDRLSDNTDGTVDASIRALTDKGSPAALAALAKRTWGSEAAFVEQMSQRARALGMTRTRFSTLDGEDPDGQATTARDVATLVWSLTRDFSPHLSSVEKPVGHDGASPLSRIDPLGRAELRLPFVGQPAPATKSQVIAVLLGKPEARTGVVRTLWSMTSALSRRVLENRPILLANFASGPSPDPEPDVRSAPGEGLRILVQNTPVDSDDLALLEAETARDVAAAQTDAVVVAAVTPPRPMAPPAKAAIQIGAFGTQAEARSALAALSSRFSHLGRAAQVVERSPAGLFRARFRFDMADEARLACSQLRQSRQACMLAPSPATAQA